VPTHALFENLDFGERCARNDRERHVALCEMDIRAVEMVSKERAARAARFPARTQHEMVDDELVAAVEQVGERLLAARRVEYIILLHLHPRQITTLATQIIARPGEGFFGGEMRLALLEPILVRYDAVIVGAHL